MARPRAELPSDAESVVGKAAYNGMKNARIAALFDVSVNTIIRRFGAVLVKQRARRELAIRSAQLKFALRGNPALLIWLGKQELGQREESFVGNLDVSKLTREELVSLEAGKMPPRLKLLSGGPVSVVG